MKLYKGRVPEAPSPLMDQINRSLPFDIRLLPFDVATNAAWAGELNRLDVFTDEETHQVLARLNEILEMYNQGKFKPLPEDEDVHTLVERLLTEKLGSTGARIHTGRSRNDQVVCDLRLYTADRVKVLCVEITDLIKALAFKAEEHVSTIMAGTTHLQPALGMAFVREKETLYQLLLNGELDFAWGLPTTRMQDINKNMQPVFYPDHSYSFIGWNPIQPQALADNPIKDRAMLADLKTRAAHPLFADARVRLAMTLAMRREHYLNLFWENHTFTPATPWQVGPFLHDGALKARPHDRDRAAQLLEESGWILKDGVRMKDGLPFRFTLAALSGNALREEYLLAIQSDLRQVGVHMDIDMQEVSRYVDVLRTRNFDAIFAVLRTGSRPDASSLFHGDAALEGGYNYTSWTSADPFLEQILNAEDVPAMLSALNHAEELFFQEQPFTMLYARIQIAAAVKDAPKPQSCFLDPLYNVEHWKRDTQ